ncbi:Six-hairpin glycosidase-like protein [Lactarius psammicola]|nr:Six-hairpin glycosidase-like protein [Lactarius psammicola]
MLPLLFIFAIAAAHTVVASCTTDISRTEQAKSVDAFLEKLHRVSNDTLFTKMMGTSIGADPGVIVTTIPDPKEPAYTVWWLRDGCRLYHTLINELSVAPFNKNAEFLRRQIDDSVRALVRSQHVVSIAGNVLTGGLDEPVFDIHINAISDPGKRFGSPAADGTAFRVGVNIKYAEWLIEPEQNNGTWVADFLWPAINLDLQWIALHWNESSYDLWWLPVWAGSYWSASLQYRALVTGARLGRNIGRLDSVATYESQAAVIREYLQESHDTFWNEEEGWMSETTITNVTTGGRSGMGPVPLTVALLNFDPTLGCDSATFQPCSDRALSYLKVVTDAHVGLFPFIKTLAPGQPPAFFAFFLEETALGGHAQYPMTLGVAEQMYNALITWDILGELEVTKVSLKFFRQFDKKVKIGTYHKHSRVYTQLTNALRNWAEQTILFVADHIPDNYVLPMAMDKTTAEPTGSPGTIHSLISALSLYNAYKGLIPPSWYNGNSGSGSLIPKESSDGVGSWGTKSQYRAGL